MDAKSSLMIRDREKNLAAVALGIHGAVFRGGNFLDLVRGLLGETSERRQTP